MKNFTKQELAQLNKMNKGAFILTPELLIEMNKISEELSNIKNSKSLFEIIYDRVGFFINKGKSIAPAELKPFA